MRITNAARYGTLVTAALSMMLSLSPWCGQAEARRHHSSHRGSSQSQSTSSTRHRGRHHGKSTHTKTASTTRHAYPLDIFMMHAPEQDLSMLPQDEALKVRYAFQSGTADNYTPAYLVRSGAVNFYPLHGGIFNRREEVKYIVVHSTETGVPQDARHVVNSWGSGGLRHAGAQYIVDRDGTIFETVDPKYATVHVNIFKTLPGINNDNSIGIEMCHTGSQTYPPEQRESVIRLVTYLQDRYHVHRDNIITHRYAQQGDHTDPVAFDWDGFLASQDSFHNKALAMKHEMPAPVATDETAVSEAEGPDASVYLQMHQTINLDAAGNRVSLQQLQQMLPPVGAIYTSHKQGETSVDNYTAVTPPARVGNKTLPIRGEIELPPDSAELAR